MQPSSNKEQKVVFREEPIHPWRWRALFICLIVIGVGFFFTVRDLRANDAAIQRSRVESCIRNYASFHEVFVPFFPSELKRTVAQKRDLAKLDRTIKKLQAHCPAQIKLKK